MAFDSISLIVDDYHESEFYNIITKNDYSLKNLNNRTIYIVNTNITLPKEFMFIKVELDSIYFNRYYNG